MSESGILLSIVKTNLDRNVIAVICTATEKAFLGKVPDLCFDESPRNLPKLLIYELTKQYLESALSKLNSCRPGDLCIERFTINSLVEPTDKHRGGLDKIENYLGKPDVGGDNDKRMTVKSDVGHSQRRVDDDEAGDVVIPDDQFGSEALLLPRDDKDVVSLEEGILTAYPVNLAANQDNYGIEVDSSDSDHTETEEGTGNACCMTERYDCEELNGKWCSENSVTAETGRHFEQGVPTDVFTRRFVRTPKIPHSDLSDEDPLHRIKLDHMSYIRYCKTTAKTEKSPKPSKLAEWECYLCGIIHCYRAELLRHIEKEHMETTPVVCDVCSKKMYTPAAFHAHQVKHFSDKQYACRICKKTFTTPQILDNYKKTYNPGNSYTCPTCGFAVRHVSEMTFFFPWELKPPLLSRKSYYVNGKDSE